MLQIDFPLALVLSGCVGALSAYLAIRQGRNPYLWFFIGTFFGLIGILAIFIAPSYKKKKTKAAPMPVVEEVILGPSQKFWYYLNTSRQQVGPMSLAALSKAWKEGTITKETWIWNEELPDWKLLKEVCGERKSTSSP